MMMLTFSSVGVSMNTLTRHRFHFVSSYHCWAIHPSQQKNIFMAIQSAHQLGHIKARSVGVEPTINHATGFDACSTALLPVLRPYIAIGSR